MHILVTGSDGFVGKNLVLKLREQESIEVSTFTRSNSLEDLKGIIPHIDYVVHLAGSNRPEQDQDFVTDNLDLTKNICDLLVNTGKDIPIIFSSSIHSDADTPYGLSKRGAEECLISYSEKTNNSIYIYKIPNIFGKWSRPNYNSVVATFCHNIANDISIDINDKNKELSLVYIDDVIDDFLQILLGKKQPEYPEIKPIYKITIDLLAKTLYSFNDIRNTNIVDKVGDGFTRALYATYISYLNPENFKYKLDGHIDDRGVFCEFLKTSNSGQFSFFTAYPGITRGGHYHHTKNEKFLVISGSAQFRFRNLYNDEKYILDVDSDNFEVVETIPGWVHDITNTGKKELIVLLWANEIFDQNKPDTFWSRVE